MSRFPIVMTRFFLSRSVRSAIIATALFASVPALAQGVPPAAAAGATVPAGLPSASAPAAAPAPLQSAAAGGTGNAVSGQSAAGHDQQWDANAFGPLEQALNAHTAIVPPSTHPEELKTLFFTAWQYALLNEAKQQFNTRPPTSSEIQNDNGQKQTGPREIALGGISYRDQKDWTVWLNSQRIKPDAIPKEILDIKVSADHVDLKWYDTSTNLIYPVRLRPHQRFNLDDRIFLPGTGT